MFEGFLSRLRAQGLQVSAGQWLALQEALEKGLHQNSLTGFYRLCRSTLLASEREFEPFDRAFREAFCASGEQRADIPGRLLDWLNRPAGQKDNFDVDQALQNRELSESQIREMLAQRLKEQDSEHNGGSYWVGTGGMSVFGNAGNSPNGIRVGGEARDGRAFDVTGGQDYADFRQDKVLDNRRFQLALRRLRQLSSGLDAPKDELDVKGTIRKTCARGGLLEIDYRRPRQNNVRLLLLMDSGGSMDAHRALCASLFQAVSRACHFRDLRTYYFHNCVYAHLYTTPACSPKHWIPTERVLRELGRDYRVLIFSDATMDPSELLGSSYYAHGARGGTGGFHWFLRIKQKYRRIAWITPKPMTLPEGSFFRESYDLISHEFDMYPMTVRELERAFRKLMVSR